MSCEAREPIRTKRERDAREKGAVPGCPHTTRERVGRERRGDECPEDEEVRGSDRSHELLERRHEHALQRRERMEREADTNGIEDMLGLEGART